MTASHTFGSDAMEATTDCTMRNDQILKTITSEALTETIQTEKSEEEEMDYTCAAVFSLRKAKALRATCGTADSTALFSEG